MLSTPTEPVAAADDDVQPPWGSAGLLCVGADQSREATGAVGTACSGAERDTAGAGGGSSLLSMKMGTASPCGAGCGAVRDSEGAGDDKSGVTAGASDVAAESAEGVDAAGCGSSFEPGSAAPCDGKESA